MLDDWAGALRTFHQLVPVAAVAPAPAAVAEPMTDARATTTRA
jgi:hypothetical protein